MICSPGIQTSTRLFLFPSQKAPYVLDVEGASTILMRDDKFAQQSTCKLSAQSLGCQLLLDTFAEIELGGTPVAECTCKGTTQHLLAMFVRVSILGVMHGALNALKGHPAPQSTKMSYTPA